MIQPTKTRQLYASRPLPHGRRPRLVVMWCLTNWTFGPWVATIGRRINYGLDLGPLAITYTRPSRQAAREIARARGAGA